MMRGATVGHVWDWAASERRFMIMVPWSMASSMGKSVSPSTYIAQLDLNIGTCLRSTYPTVFLSLFPAITILADSLSMSGGGRDVRACWVGGYGRGWRCGFWRGCLARAKRWDRARTRVWSNGREGVGRRCSLVYLPLLEYPLPDYAPRLVQISVVTDDLWGDDEGWDKETMAWRPVGCREVGFERLQENQGSECDGAVQLHSMGEFCCWARGGWG